MTSLKRIVFLFVFCFSVLGVNAQYEIKPVEGYTPQIGVMVNMLEDLKSRITEMTHDLSQEETDFLFDDKANSIGALIMHLAATESYYQVETLENRQWTEEESEFWGIATGLGEKQRKELQGKPISYYLDLWDEVRSKTLKGLKAKDDIWFAANVDENVNNHWAWFHILEHSANHMGQISLVKNRLPE
ncbi:DUF664 domain-containing protein [Sungkyunkwania multivorans]|uniref:DUF664 domain-containing protein n=1 Tax=Sungkyunkwania multivorans TaxID=1173618 RepID=A0ABW3D164_9FLAO